MPPLEHPREPQIVQHYGEIDRPLHLLPEDCFCFRQIVSLFYQSGAINYCPNCKRTVTVRQYMQEVRDIHFFSNDIFPHAFVCIRCQSYVLQPRPASECPDCVNIFRDFRPDLSTRSLVIVIFETIARPRLLL